MCQVCACTETESKLCWRNFCDRLHQNLPFYKRKYYFIDELAKHARYVLLTSTISILLGPHLILMMNNVCILFSIVVYIMYVCVFHCQQIFYVFRPKIHRRQAECAVLNRQLNLLHASYECVRGFSVACAVSTWCTFGKWAILTVASHEHHGVSNHRWLDSLFNRLVPKKRSKLNWFGLREGKPLVTAWISLTKGP